MAIQNARVLGIPRIFAAGRSRDKLEQLRLLGATDLITITKGQVELGEFRPDLVLDYLWGGPAEATFRALTRRSLDDDRSATNYVQIGDAAGSNARVPAHLLRSSNIAISGSGAGATPMSEIRQQIPRYVELIGSGRIHIPVKVYPLREVHRAWDDQGEGHRVVVTA
jgi:NADPH:quinone reductase-like Zn-dependent oxidoreductase